ncbi:hypothetical protein BCR44DRAFT_80432 [Catenaria anguillulae PL171]|uniref:Uncharacterized protein n=1 Tax=Catenaria anguillulae PL171 TaxID=765915 RepID=A0A1Y2HUF3_9FUNG|nr:hypothetical protein BCR44DRAFT_80432 [Catenaria anguillulae PL171]
MNPPIPDTTPYERPRHRTPRTHSSAANDTDSSDTLNATEHFDAGFSPQEDCGKDDDQALPHHDASSPSLASDVQQQLEPLPPHHLPIELWSLIAARVAHSKETDPKWRLYLARLAHTCRSAYIAAFPTLWAHLHLQFVRNNTELAPAQSTVVNAAEYHDDPHLEYRLAWVRRARRQFDVGMVFPSACTRTDLALLSRMTSISECLLLAPLVIRQGMPYLASLAANETCQKADLDKIRASIERLWGPVLPDDCDILDRVSIINDLVLVPYPLHLVKHIAINDLDTSVDLGVDLLYPNTTHYHQAPPTCTPTRKPSWTHVLPFLLQLPPSNIRSIRFLSSSPCASRLTAELVQRYPYAQDKEAVYSGDHEHRFPSMTPSTRNVRLFLDGDLDSAASTVPDLFPCASPDPKPTEAVSPGRLTPRLNVSTIELRGRTSYLPFDEPPAGLHDMFTIRTLTSLVLDVDFDYDVNDAGSFPIRLPGLLKLTLTMRIAKLIFSQNQHIVRAPGFDPAFPALLELTLLNDLDPPATSTPTASTLTRTQDARMPRRVPVIPPLPFSHIPQLASFTIPSHFRGRPAPCALQVAQQNPLAVQHSHLPNAVFLGAHMLAHVKDLRRPIICDTLVATSKRLEAHYAMRAVEFPKLVSVGLHVWDWRGDPTWPLGECRWKGQLKQVKVVFDGPRVWSHEWMVGLCAFENMTRLTIEQSLRTTDAVRLVACDSDKAMNMPHLEMLTVRFPNAPLVDFAGVALGAHARARAGLHLPKLRTLAIHAPATCNLPSVTELAGLVRIMVQGPPCPRLIAPLLAAAALSRVHVAFDADTLESHVAGPRITMDAGARQPLVFSFTAHNRRVWHALLTADAVASGAVPSAIVVQVSDRLDAVDARTIVRVMRGLLGNSSPASEFRVSVCVDKWLAKQDPGSMANAQWAAHELSGRHVDVAG